MPLTTTPSERIGRCTRMRRLFVRVARSESFVHTRSSAGFTIITSGFEFSVHTAEDRPHLADLRPIAERNQRPKRSGAIFLQASTKPCTAPTDLSNASRSLPASSISTMRSTPFDPMTTGTPTYMSFTPYSPLR